MKNMIFALLITIVPFSAHATVWHGTSTTYGNTTYHQFHSSGVQVIPAGTSHHYYHDNSGAVAAGAAVGVVAGVLLCKAISSFWNKPKNIHPQYYFDHATQTWYYYGK